ncbi:MAG: alkene reductase [Bacteroidota bacterium]
MSQQLFTTYQLGGAQLQNRVVMAPLTRSRAIGNIPNDLMATYYGQRNGAGLIITEGTSPSPNGLGYPRIPGAYSAEQVAGWKKVTAAVHEGGAKIFLQIMHTGRVGHTLNLPEGGEVIAPSPLAAADQIYTDAEGQKELPIPREMTLADIENAIEEYVLTAKNAMEAGFDGVELHAANGYLIEQFTNPTSNKRTDEYGGGIENRAKFLLTIAEKVGTAIGTDKVGVRLSPNGVNAAMKLYDQDKTVADFNYVAEHLKDKVVYIHIADHSSMGTPALPTGLKASMKEKFGGTFLMSGGLSKESAEAAIQAGEADLVVFGRQFLANPDLIERFKQDAPLNDPNFNTFYTPGAEGYTDYPTL